MTEKMDFEKDFMKVKQTNNPLKEGCMLVSVPFYNDAYFHRSVVLLTDYQSPGTAGVIINKRTNLTIRKTMPEWNIDGKFYFGGSVTVEGVIALHNFYGNGRYHPLGEGLYAGIDPILISLIEQRAIVNMKYRFYLGYAGWDEGQLEREIKHKMWVVLDYHPELIFDTTPSKVWEKAVRLLGPEYSHWLDVPADVAEN